jgi:alkylated DNA repair dioxygenase AlkB
MPDKIEIIEGFVGESFEKQVLKLLPNKVIKRRNRNQILRYGSNKPYDNGLVSDVVPQFLEKETKAFFRNLKNQDLEFDSVTINEYLEGQIIDWHIDKPASGSSIYIISLLSDANLSFRLGEVVVDYFVPRFSLTIFSEDLRWKWQHSLKAEQRRVSVVFRNSKEKV